MLDDAVDTAAPLADTAARLNALDAYAGFDVAPAPAADWLPLAGLTGGSQLDALLARLVERHVRRNVAGSMLGCILVEAVIGPTVAAMVIDDRCPDPATGNVLIRVHEELYLDRRAFLGPAVAVLPGDPAAADPSSVVVADEAALADWWAARVVATLTPLLEAVRARTPFGLRLLWGEAADEVAGTAIRVAQLAGRDADAAWERGQRLVDALARHAPLPLVRSSPFPVTYPGGRQLFQVRGTCCLYYRSALETGPLVEACCSTCPLRDDDSRHRRLRDYCISCAA